MVPLSDQKLIELASEIYIQLPDELTKTLAMLSHKQHLVVSVELIRLVAAKQKRTITIDIDPG